jgi:hypothetical protein
MLVLLTVPFLGSRRHTLTRLFEEGATLLNRQDTLKIRENLDEKENNGGTRFGKRMGFGSLTDEQAQSLTSRSLALDEAVAQLRIKYVPIINRVLPSPKTATFFQMDRRNASNCGSRTCSFSKYRKTNNLQMGEKIEFP